MHQAISHDSEILRLRQRVRHRAIESYGRDFHSARGYSRSAIVGATRDARRAGSHAASRLTSASAPAARTNEAGSHGAKLNSRLRAYWALSTASATPMTTPSANRMPDSPSTMRTTFRGSAPSAIRMPISTWRRVTMYEMTPYSPTVAISIARTPKNPEGDPINRRVTSESRM